MKTVNDLKIERSKKIEQMEDLVKRVMEENRNKDEAETKLWNDLDTEVKGLDEKISMLERQEELNKRSIVSFEIKEERKSLSERFAEAMASASRGQMASFKASLAEFRAEPLLSNTITQQNTQLGGISIVKQDAKSFLQGLGTKVYTGVKGQITLTSAAAGNATFPGENTTDVSLNLVPAMLTLAPRRCSINTTYTKEFAANVNDQAIADVMLELEDALWRRIATDLMYNFLVDANDASTTIAGSTLAATDIYNLEAGISTAPKSPAFVTSPKVSGYLKGLATIASVAGPVWNGNPYVGSIDGIPAYGTPYTGTTAVNGVGSVTSEQLFYGDFSEAAVAQFGEVEFTFNPYTYAKEGKIEVVADTMADSGIVNYRAFKWIKDVSIA
jgi:hypothetical protein